MKVHHFNWFIAGFCTAAALNGLGSDYPLWSVFIPAFFAIGNVVCAVALREASE